MSKKDRPTVYLKIRIDTDDRNIVCDLVQQHCSGKFIYAFENVGETNPHVHLFMECKSRKATVAQYIRNKGFAGNGGYSCTEAREEYPLEHLAYIIKGKVYTTNYDEAQVNQILAYNDEVVAEFKKKIKQKRNALQVFKDSTLRWRPVVKYFDEYKGEISNSRNWWIEPPEMYAARLMKLVYRHYKEKNQHIAQFSVIKMIDTLLLLEHPDGEEYLYNKTHQSYFNQRDKIDTQAYKEISKLDFAPEDKKLYWDKCLLLHEENKKLD